MAIQSYKMGPGTLKFGAGLAQNATAQITNGLASCTENVASDEDVDVLSGEQLAGEERLTYSWLLAFNLVQDLAAAGLIAWSWANKGTEQAFEFVPNTVGARKITGTIIVAPISAGGDVKTRPRSDVSWRGKKGTDFVLADV